jgi:hypothetical protein
MAGIVYLAMVCVVLTCIVGPVAAQATAAPYVGPRTAYRFVNMTLSRGAVTNARRFFVSGCTFVGSYSVYPALSDYVSRRTAHDIDVRVVDCVFLNAAVLSFPGRIANSSVVLDNVVFRDNTYSSSSVPIANVAFSFPASNSELSFRRCTFHANYRGVVVAALRDSSSLSVRDCTFAPTRVLRSSYTYSGVTVNSYDNSEVVITDNKIRSTLVGGRAASVFAYSASMVRVVGNEVSLKGGLAFRIDASGASCVVVADNTIDIAAGPSSLYSVASSYYSSSISAGIIISVKSGAIFVSTNVISMAGVANAIAIMAASGVVDITGNRLSVGSGAALQLPAAIMGTMRIGFNVMTAASGSILTSPSAVHGGIELISNRFVMFVTFSNYQTSGLTSRCDVGVTEAQLASLGGTFTSSECPADVAAAQQAQTSAWQLDCRCSAPWPVLTTSPFGASYNVVQLGSRYASVTISDDTTTYANSVLDLSCTTAVITGSVFGGIIVTQATTLTISTSTIGVAGIHIASSSTSGQTTLSSVTIGSATNRATYGLSIAASYNAVRMTDSTVFAKASGVHAVGARPRNLVFMRNTIDVANSTGRMSGLEIRAAYAQNEVYIASNSITVTSTTGSPTQGVAVGDLYTRSLSCQVLSNTIALAGSGNAVGIRVVKGDVYKVCITVSSNTVDVTLPTGAISSAARHGIELAGSSYSQGGIGAFSVTSNVLSVTGGAASGIYWAGDARRMHTAYVSNTITATGTSGRGVGINLALARQSGHVAELNTITSSAECIALPDASQAQTMIELRQNQLNGNSPVSLSTTNAAVRSTCDLVHGSAATAAVMGTDVTLSTSCARSLLPSPYSMSGMPLCVTTYFVKAGTETASIAATTTGAAVTGSATLTATTGNIIVTSSSFGDLTIIVGTSTVQSVTLTDVTVTGRLTLRASSSYAAVRGKTILLQRVRVKGASQASSVAVSLPVVGGSTSISITDCSFSASGAAVSLGRPGDRTNRTNVGLAFAMYNTRMSTAGASSGVCVAVAVAVASTFAIDRVECSVRNTRGSGIAITNLQGARWQATLAVTNSKFDVQLSNGSSTAAAIQTGASITGCVRIENNHIVARGAIGVRIIFASSAFVSIRMNVMDVTGVGRGIVEVGQSNTGSIDISHNVITGAQRYGIALYSLTSGTAALLNNTVAMTSGTALRLPVVAYGIVGSAIPSATTAAVALGFNRLFPHTALVWPTTSAAYVTSVCDSLSAAPTYVTKEDMTAEITPCANLGIDTFAVESDWADWGSTCPGAITVIRALNATALDREVGVFSHLATTRPVAVAPTGSLAISHSVVRALRISPGASTTTVTLKNVTLTAGTLYIAARPATARRAATTLVVLLEDVTIGVGGRLPSAGLYLNGGDGVRIIVRRTTIRAMNAGIIVTNGTGDDIQLSHVDVQVSAVGVGVGIWLAGRDSSTVAIEDSRIGVSLRSGVAVSSARLTGVFFSALNSSSVHLRRNSITTVAGSIRNYGQLVHVALMNKACLVVSGNNVTAASSFAYGSVVFARNMREQSVLTVSNNSVATVGDSSPFYFYSPFHSSFANIVNNTLASERQQANGAKATLQYVVIVDGSDRDLKSSQLTLAFANNVVTAPQSILLRHSRHAANTLVLLFANTLRSVAGVSNDATRNTYVGDFHAACNVDALGRQVKYNRFTRVHYWTARRCNESYYIPSADQCGSLLDPLKGPVVKSMPPGIIAAIVIGSILFGLLLCATPVLLGKFAAAATGKHEEDLENVRQEIRALVLREERDAAAAEAAELEAREQEAAAAAAALLPPENEMENIAVIGAVGAAAAAADDDDYALQRQDTMTPVNMDPLRQCQVRLIAVEMYEETQLVDVPWSFVAHVTRGYEKLSWVSEGGRSVGFEAVGVFGGQLRPYLIAITKLSAAVSLDEVRDAAAVAMTSSHLPRLYGVARHTVRSGDGAMELGRKLQMRVAEGDRFSGKIMELLPQRHSMAALTSDTSPVASQLTLAHRKFLVTRALEKFDALRKAGVVVSIDAATVAVRAEDNAVVLLDFNFDASQRSESRDVRGAVRFIEALLPGTAVPAHAANMNDVMLHVYELDADAVDLDGVVVASYPVKVMLECCICGLEVQSADDNMRGAECSNDARHFVCEECVNMRLSAAMSDAAPDLTALACALGPHCSGTWEFEDFGAIIDPKNLRRWNHLSKVQAQRQAHVDAGENHAKLQADLDGK